MDAMSFDSGLVVWTILTFICLCALLARFAFKPLSKALQRREETIQSSLDKAQHAKDEAARILALNETQLAEARKDAQKTIEEGYKIVAEMKREATERAKAEADILVTRARTEIDNQLQKSLDELKGTVANLSIRIARQVIKDQMDEKRHEQLAGDFIERLKKSHATGKP